MILLGNLLISIGVVLDYVLSFYFIIFFLLFIFSWVNPDPSNVFVQFVRGATDPILNPLRRRIPPLGILDTSFLVAFLGLIFIQSFLVPTLKEYGALMKARAAFSTVKYIETLHSWS